MKGGDNEKENPPKLPKQQFSTGEVDEARNADPPAKVESEPGEGAGEWKPLPFQCIRMKGVFQDEQREDYQQGLRN